MTTTTVNKTHPVDGMIASAMLSGAYCCKSWTYSVLKADPREHKNARSRNYGPFKTKNKKHGVKLIKNIQIKHISTGALFLLVEYQQPVNLQIGHLQISRSQFELWLYQTCRLDWCLTEIDHTPLKDKDTVQTEDWIYDKYGITKQDLATYIYDQGLLNKCNPFT